MRLIDFCLWRVYYVVGLVVSVDFLRFWVKLADLNLQVVFEYLVFLLVCVVDLGELLETTCSVVIFTLF